MNPQTPEQKVEDSNKKEIIDFYSSFASTYEKNTDARGVNQTLALEVNQIRKVSPTSIVEFGLGTGRFARALLKELPEDVRYVGVEISPAMLDQAKDLSGRVELVKADFESYIEKSDSFDVCIAPYTVFCHVDFDYQIPLLEKIQKKCRHVFINVPTVQYEEKVWGPKNKFIKFLVPQTEDFMMTVFRINPELRGKAVKSFPLDKEREILYFV